MTGHEINTYLLPAIRNLYGKDATSVEASTLLSLIGRKYLQEFENWFKVQEFQNWFEETAGLHRNSRMDDHLRSILTALAGPHGRTLFKVLEINKVEA